MVRGLVPVASPHPSAGTALCQGIGPWPLQAVGPWEGEGTQGLPPTQSRLSVPAPANIIITKEALSTVQLKSPGAEDSEPMLCQPQ